MGKYLGIGLPKTGTSSLDQALRMLGFESFHNSRGHRERYLQSKWDFFKSGTSWDAITNMFENTFPVIDEMFPGTKFIYTRRDVESWLVSAKHSFEYLDQIAEDADAPNLNRLEIEHCSHFNEPIMRHAHRSHELAVADYFKDRPDDILEIDIVGGEGWEKLCPFVGRQAEPNWHFPHNNKRERYN